MAGKKRECELELEEFDDLSSVSHTSSCANIHGVLTQLSPMKKSRSSSCSYFDGELSDGKNSMRVFGFESSVQRKLADFYKKDLSLSLAVSNCERKRSRNGEHFEVLLKKSSDVEKSPSKFDVQVADSKSSL